MSLIGEAMDNTLKPITRAALAVLVLLTACVPPVSQTDTSAEVLPLATVTLSAGATATLSKQDYLPTYQAKMTLWATEVSPTTTQTPTPLLSAKPMVTRTPTLTGTPTLKPDFNALAATYTPPPRAICPQPNPDVVLDEGGFERLHEIFPYAGKETSSIENYRIPFEELEEGFHQLQEDIATYLSQSGALSQIQALFDQQDAAAEPHYYGELKRVDVTGDGVPEVFVWLALPLSKEALYPQVADLYDRAFGRAFRQTQLFVYTCENGKYVTAGDFIEVDVWSGMVRVMPIVTDLNRDGVNEFIQHTYTLAPVGYSIEISIWRWDGVQISKLHLDELYGDVVFSYMVEASIWNDEVNLGYGSYELLDVDGNGTTEVVFSGGSGSGASCYLLYRDTKLVLMWNGHGFSSYYQRTPPVYRIQAVWDGDHMASRGYFEEALAFFEQAINDDDLLTWSPEFSDVYLCDYMLTPMPENPVLDEGERERLTAYSLYRMMWLHTAMGNLEEAQALYDRLVIDHGESIYAQLGAAFWTAYQASSDFDPAHRAAVAFTAEHGEAVCIPLTGNYGDGMVKWIYANNNEDVCPPSLFR
ncbi:MAG: hypothetical protein JXB38_14255 [Anaerolineales bacterium]|nr:hypothetical protein [Anaerolineales bacterium]